MRFLGIDYGTKRVGLAISDDNHKLAFPKEIIENTSDIFQKLSEIIKKENISEIVIGESVDFKGRANALSRDINIFVLGLEEKFKLPIHRQKEFLTSVEARRPKDNLKAKNEGGAHKRIKKPRGNYIDAEAAALILQRYLDKIK
ncbi:MAG: Holliday junction resolvase RuvX [Minisyncoccia bacterium]